MFVRSWSLLVLSFANAEEETHTHGAFRKINRAGYGNGISFMKVGDNVGCMGGIVGQSELSQAQCKTQCMANAGCMSYVTQPQTDTCDSCMLYDTLCESQMENHCSKAASKIYRKLLPETIETSDSDPVLSRISTLTGAYGRVNKDKIPGKMVADEKELADQIEHKMVHYKSSVEKTADQVATDIIDQIKKTQPTLVTGTKSVLEGWDAIGGQNEALLTLAKTSAGQVEDKDDLIEQKLQAAEEADAEKMEKIASAADKKFRDLAEKQAGAMKLLADTAKTFTTEDVEKDVKKMGKHAARVDTMYANNKKMLQTVLKRQKKGHKKRMDKVLDQQNELQVIMTRTHAILSEIPQYLKQKGKAYGGALKDETHVREAKVEALTQEYKKAEIKIAADALRMNTELLDTYGNTTVDSQLLAKEHLGMLTDEKTSFTADVAGMWIMDPVKTYRRGVNDELADVAYKTVQNLQSTAHGGEHMMEKTADELVEEIAAEKAFPRKAEGAMAALTAYSTEEFGKTRKEREDFLKETGETFDTEMKYDEEDAVKKVQKHANDFEKLDLKAVTGSTERADKLIEPAVNTLTHLYTKVAHVKNSAESGFDEAESVAKQGKNLLTQMDRAEKSVRSRINQSDKKILARSLNIQKQAQSNIDTFHKNVEITKTRAIKHMHKNQKDLTDTFEDTAEKARLDTKKDITSTDYAATKLDKLQTSIAEKLMKKVTQVRGEVDRVAKEQMPALVYAAGDFMGEAVKQIEEVPQETNLAITVTDQIVQDNLSKMQTAADRAIAGVQQTVDPVTERTHLHAISEKQHMNEDLTSFQNDVTKMVTESKEYLENFSDTNKATKKEFGENKYSLGEAFELATDTVGKQDEAVENHLQIQESKLDQFENSMSSNIKDRAKSVEKDVLQPEQEEATDFMGKSLERSTKEVTDFQAGMSKLVARVIQGVTDQADRLGSKSDSLKSMLREAESSTTAIKTRTEAQTRALNEKVESQAQSARDANSALVESLDDKTVLTEKQNTIKFNNIREGTKESLAEASELANQDATKAEEHVKATSAQMEKSLEGLKAATAKQVLGASDGVDNLQQQVENVKRTEKQKDAALQAKFDSIKESGEASDAEFEAEMAKAGKMLAGMVDDSHEEMGDLTKKLGAVTSFVQSLVNKQEDKDAIFLESLLEEAKKATAEAKTRTDSASVSVTEFTERVKELGRVTDNAAKEAEGARSNNAEKLSNAAKRFNERLQKEQLSRQSDTQKLADSTKSGLASMDSTMTQLSALETKVTASVNYQLGKLNLQETKINRELKSAVQLEQYSDVESLNRLRKKGDEVREKQASLDTWSSHVRNGWEHFKDLLTVEFKKLGAEFDTSELEASEMEAMEQWAIQDQMHKMAKHLGDEIHDLNDASQARLAALAARSGKALAALMANKDLSDEERAKLIAELQEKSRQEAKGILEENGHLKLDQATAARNLQIATDEVQHSTEMIANLESPKVPPAKSVSEAIDRIHALLREVNIHMSDVPAEEQVAESLVPAEELTAEGSVQAEDSDVEGFVPAKMGSQSIELPGAMPTNLQHRSPVVTPQLGDEATPSPSTASSLLAVAAARTAAVLEQDVRSV